MTLYEPWHHVGRPRWVDMGCRTRTMVCLANIFVSNCRGSSVHNFLLSRVVFTREIKACSEQEKYESTEKVLRRKLYCNYFTIIRNILYIIISISTLCITVLSGSVQGVTVTFSQCTYILYCREYSVLFLEWVTLELCLHFKIA